MFEYLMDFATGISIVVFSITTTAFIVNLAEARQLYTETTRKQRRYDHSKYRLKLETLKPLICTTIITGHIWMSTALIRMIT